MRTSRTLCHPASVEVSRLDARARESRIPIDYNGLLESHVDPRVGAVPAECRPDEGPRRGAPRATALGEAGRRRQVHRAAPRAGQAAGARADRAGCSTRVAVSRAFAARGMGSLRRRRALGRDRHRHRPRLRARSDDRGERRDGQGRHLLSDDGQEARAGAAGRARESPAVHLSRRLRRRVPAAAGRSLSRSRPLRPHLLQPGAHVGRAHPADRRRDGIVHGRRRLRAGHVGRNDHRQGHGHDFPGRAAAGEGRHRRRSDRRGTRRRRRPHAAVGRRRLPGRRRRACAADLRGPSSAR